jgi:hypothetical protein
MITMIDQILSGIFTNQWLVIGIVSALLLAAAEFGFRCGLRLHMRKDDARKTQVNGVQAAVLGLLALLLGFTFAIAAGRYESRRQIVLQEANAIGTTYLRASFLPQEHQRSIEDLLRRYVNIRLASYGPDANKATLAASEAQAAQVHRELWAHAVAAGKEAPTPLVAVFLAPLNETIDLDAVRLAANRSHVPGAVWLLVLAVSTCGCAMSGYGAGSSGVRCTSTNWLLPALIAVVITLIADLDRPHGGLIHISQQPMLDLKQSLESAQP